MQQHLKGALVMNKKQYEAPEMELIIFESEDVITNSPIVDEDTVKGGWI